LGEGALSQALITTPRFNNLFEVQEGDPQGLKPAFWADVCGTALSRALPKTRLTMEFSRSL
jgi:hypothetical protein